MYVDGIVCGRGQHRPGINSPTDVSDAMLVSSPCKQVFLDEIAGISNPEPRV